MGRAPFREYPTLGYSHLPCRESLCGKIAISYPQIQDSPAVIQIGYDPFPSNQQNSYQESNNDQPSHPIFQNKSGPQNGTNSRLHTPFTSLASLLLVGNILE
ncbi:hypothetical protein ABW19_dt0201018 [Dactylella cylindrospora]|nr:hypothetical protein ABW19_dt0201018 [Dactylella cylindrospora]